MPRTSTISNAAYSVADYVSQPLGMLLAAPLLIHRLGLSQYGIWMLVTAVVGSMGTLSGGFGDAAVKYVSAYRGRNDTAGVIRSIRGMLAINGTLGGLLAVAIAVASSFLANHVFRIEPALLSATTVALRLGAAVLFVRCVEAVFIAALRAFEQYGPTVKINVFSRAGTVVAAVVLAAAGFGVAAIMAATLAIAAISMCCQMIASQRVIGRFMPLPSLNRAALSELLAFGCFSWLQALAAVGFNYADRLLVATLLGTSALAYYMVCVQAASPIHGLIQAALNVLFPHVSARQEAGESDATRDVIRRAFIANAALAVLFCLPLALFSRQILTLWMGAAFARTASPVLAILAIGYGMLALNITGHYVLLALGEVRLVSALNIGGGIATLVTAVILAAPLGLYGIAVGRIIYGPITWLAYIRLARILRGRSGIRTALPLEISLAETER